MPTTTFDRRGCFNPDLRAVRTRRGGAVRHDEAVAKLDAVLLPLTEMKAEQETPPPIWDAARGIHDYFQWKPAALDEDGFRKEWDRRFGFITDLELQRAPEKLLVEALQVDAVRHGWFDKADDVDCYLIARRYARAGEKADPEGAPCPRCGHQVRHHRKYPGLDEGKKATACRHQLLPDRVCGCLVTPPPMPMEERVSRGLQNLVVLVVVLAVLFLLITALA